MNKGPTELTIGALSEQTGVNVETIRYYEREGLLPSAPRTAGGHRVFAEVHLRATEVHPPQSGTRLLGKRGQDAFGNGGWKLYLR
jgi:hypothetical protein